MNKLSLAIVAALLGSAASAADFRVTRTDDPAPDGCFFNDCSVREAVMAANAAPDADRVILRALTYNLTRTDSSPDTHQADLGPLWVTSSINFVGAGAGSTVLRWNTGFGHPGTHANPVIHGGQPSSNPIVVEVNALTISHGRGAQGGCVNFSGAGSTLTFNSAVLQSCYSPSTGGALHVHNGTLNLNQSTLRQNTAVHGGAMILLGIVSVTSSNSLITGNSAESNGGGIYIFGSALAGLFTTINWVDNGGTVISDNVAGQSGGGIMLRDTSSLFLSTAARVPSTSWLVIRDNVAAGVGGGIHNAQPYGGPLQTRLDRVRILANEASDGGGIATSSALNVFDAEIALNQAKLGVGGGIALLGSVNWEPGRSLNRVSLRSNQAASGGGGIHSTCATFNATDVSMHGNTAASGRGQAIETEGTATLRHLTLYGNMATWSNGSPGLSKRYTTACPDTTVRVANSLIADYCAAANGGLFSDGGNQLGPFATNCPALQSVDQRQSSNNVFRLGYGAYGGPFEVVGWPADLATRPQRNFGVASYCSSTDVRGFARADGLCDAGAFEQ